MGEKKHKVKRVVLDTNILISALLFEGRASVLVGLWKQGRITPLISAEKLKEIIRVLAYPKFKLSEREIKSIINEDILPYVETVEIFRKIEGVCVDAGDDMFLSCAVNGIADAIISVDIHLLKLKEIEGIPILKLVDLINRL